MPVQRSSAHGAVEHLFRMARAIDDYDQKRRHLIDRLVDQMAKDRGLYVGELIPSQIREALEHDALRVYEIWLARVSESQLEMSAGSNEGLFTELYSLELVMHELIETGRGPSDSLH